VGKNIKLSKNSTPYTLAMAAQCKTTQNINFSTKAFYKKTIHHSQAKVHMMTTMTIIF